MKPERAIALGIIALLFLGLVMSAFYTIQSGTVGVLATFGKYREEEMPPGLHVKIPLVQQVKVFDVKLQTVTYKGHKDLPDMEGVYRKPAIQVLDNKNLPIGIELSVQFTPMADRASEILERYGENYFDKLINPVVRDIVRDVIGKYQAEEIADKRSQIGEEIKVRLAKRFERLPFTLNDVALRDIQLPQVVLKKIEEVQLAKQEEQRLAMVEKQARKEQEIKTIQANTRLIEITTQAKADAEKKRIGADARAYQIKAEAEAVAAANKLIAASLTPELISYKHIEKWDGRYPQTLLSGQESSVLLSLPR